MQVPFPREEVTDRDDPIHVPVPFPEDGTKSRLDLPDKVNHTPLEMVRFAASVDDVEEDGVPAAEGDVVPVAHLDASDIADAHAVKRVVHEILDRREHRGDEVRILVRGDVAGEGEGGRAAAVREVDMLHEPTERVGKIAHPAFVVVEAIIPWW